MSIVVIGNAGQLSFELVRILGEDTKFSATICNPPFYQGTYAIKDVGRDQARNHAFLPLIELFAGIGQLLSAHGSCSVILPIEHKEMATHEAQKNGLYLSRFTAVKGNETAPVKRALLSYSRLANSCESTVLTLEVARHQRTKTHQELVADFYLPKP